MALSIVFVSILVLIDLNKGEDAHDINTPSQSDPRNQLLINTTSTQRPLLTLEALMNESLLTTNPTNNIPSSSNSIYANSSNPDNISSYSTSTTLQSRQMTLLTLIGTGIFITAVILIIRARYGICKTRLRKKMSVSESNMAQSIKTHEIESEIVKPHIIHYNSQHGVAADNMLYASDGSGESVSPQNTPQSRPSGNSNSINTGLEHVADPPQALEIRLSIADSVNKHNHKSPKGSDSMNQRIKEYLQSQLHDNEIAGHRSRLSVASAHTQQWRMILAQNNQGQGQLPSMQHDASASLSNYGEHTHTMTKSVEIGYAEYQNIYVGQRIDALQEDEEVDVFDVREPGSPCPGPYTHIQHLSHDSLDGDHAEIKIPDKPQRKIRATDGIAEDEFIVDDGESSHGMMTHGEDDVDEVSVPGDEENETIESDPDIPDSHDSDNDIIMDMDMNTKGFIE